MIYLQLLAGVLLVALALFIATRITLATGWRDVLAVHALLAFVWGTGYLGVVLVQGAIG